VMKRARLGELFLALLILLPLLAAGLQHRPSAELPVLLPWLARLTGVLALTLILLAGILSIRLPGMDRWFGGLTRLWAIHHGLGWAGFMLVMVHVWLVAGSGLVQSVQVSVNMLFPPLGHWPVWAGWGSFLALLVFLAPSFKFFGEPRYPRWKRLHLVSALALLLAVVHALSLAASIWPWLLLGTAAALAYGWRKLLSPRLARRTYRVTEVKHLGPDMVELGLRAEGRPMQHAPGQFIYLTPRDPALAQGRGEEHPYTIASAPGAPLLRVGIKALGDGTRALQNLSPDSLVQLEGPYGDFMGQGDASRAALWIGGGIGIAPFVSAVRALHQARQGQPPTHLIYLVNNDSEAYYQQELQSLAQETEALQLNLHRRDSEGLLDEATLRALCPDFTEREIWICGPPGLTRHLKTLLHARGVPGSRIHSEAFNLL